MRPANTAHFRTSPFLGEILGAALLFACVLVIYFPCLGGPYFWDDYSLLQAPELRGRLLRLWCYPPTITLEEHYWPVTYSLFWLVGLLGNWEAFWFHVLNILLHGVNAVLVWRVLRHLHVKGAFYAALLFAVHPVHVESVAWIIELKDVLSAFFFLSALLLYVRTGVETLPKSKRFTFWICVYMLYVFACWSKSVALTLPAVIVIIDVWRSPAALRHRIWGWAVFFLLAGGLLAADLYVAHRMSHASVSLPWSHRLELIGRTFWWYVAKIVSPQPLLAMYPRWTLGETGLSGWLPSALLVGGGVAILWAARRWTAARAVAVAGAVYLTCLLPTLGVLPHSYMAISYVADRYQYLASIAPLSLIASAIWTLLESFKTNRTKRLLVGAIAAIICSWYASMTYEHAALYGNPEKLLEHTVRDNPSAFTAHLLLGAMKASRGKLDEALPHLQQSVALNAEDSSARANLALVLWRKGDYSRALAETSISLSRSPNHAMSWAVHAAALARLGETTAATAAAKRALELAPGNPLAEKVLLEEFTSTPK